MVADGVGFPEGPVAMADGSVLFVDITKQTLSRLTADGRIDVVAEIPGGPNGAAIGPDGAIYICNNGGVYSFVPFGSNGVTMPGPAAQQLPGRLDPAGRSGDRKGHGSRTMRTMAPGCSRRMISSSTKRADSGSPILEFRIPKAPRWELCYYATIDGRSIVKAATIPTAQRRRPLAGRRDCLCVGHGFRAALGAGHRWVRRKVRPGPLPIMPGRVVQTLPGFQ